MAQYRVEAPKDANIRVRAGGRAYTFLAGTAKTVECGGDAAGRFEANGLSVEHVGDEESDEHRFHREKVEAARAGPAEDLNDFAPVEAKVGALKEAVDEEEGDPSDPSGAVVVDLDSYTIPELKEYAKAHDVNLKGVTAKADILAAIKGTSEEEE